MPQILTPRDFSNTKVFQTTILHSTVSSYVLWFMKNLKAQKLKNSKQTYLILAVYIV